MQQACFLILITNWRQAYFEILHVQVRLDNQLNCQVFTTKHGRQVSEYTGVITAIVTHRYMHYLHRYLCCFLVQVQTCPFELITWTFQILGGVIFVGGSVFPLRLYIMKLAQHFGKWTQQFCENGEKKMLFLVNEAIFSIEAIILAQEFPQLWQIHFLQTFMKTNLPHSNFHTCDRFSIKIAFETSL